jgi:hypothetical protein
MIGVLSLWVVFEDSGGFVVVAMVIIGFGIGMLVVRRRVLDNACFFFRLSRDDEGSFLGGVFLVSISLVIACFGL